MSAVDQQSLLIALHGDNFAERYTSFHKLLAAERKSTLLARKEEETRYLKQRQQAASQVAEAAGSLFADVSQSGGPELTSNLQSSPSSSPWSSLLRFQWAPPALDFVKARFCAKGEFFLVGGNLAIGHLCLKSI